MSATSKKLEAIYDAAIGLSPEERILHLARACGGDEELRRQVERLLKAHDRAGNFLTRGDRNSPPREEIRGEQTAPGWVETAVAPTRFASPPLVEAPGSVIGRYKLLQQIGEGGFGVVYMAEQKEPVKRKVALKIIKLGMDTKQVVARFEAERQALALMDHPNIAKFLDGGMTGETGKESGGGERQGSRSDGGQTVEGGSQETDAPYPLTPDHRLPAPCSGRPYFVMELVKGVPITKFCDENNLSTKERLALFTTVCHAVQHAHQKGIIHRDIKPSNILVTLHDGKPVPKVIDFGIAKATQQELTEKTIFTQFQQMIGTPAYMSPEQAEMSGLDLDTRTDIYSLGVLLYELLTGKTPLDVKALLNNGYDEIRRRIKEEEPLRPSTRVSTMAGEELTANAKHRLVDPKRFAAELRGDLDWIVMKALEKDRTRRYDSATGFAQDIQRFIANEPIVARPPSQLYRIQKLVRRNKLAFAAAGAISLALLLGTVVSIWQALQAIRAKDEAKASEQTAQAARTNESLERKRAEAEAVRAEENSLLLKIQRAEDFFAADNASSALAYLAQVLRQSPTNYVAALRLVSALTQRNLPLPTTKPLSHEDKVSLAEFSQDGQRVVTASSDGTARVWDSHSGKPLSPPLRHNDVVTTARFSPDGKRVVTASRDKTAQVWDAAEGRSLVGPLQHNFPVISARFSPDGRKIVTTAAYDPVRIWDSATGQLVTLPLGHNNSTFWAVFSPDGRRVLTASSDESARVWDANAGELITRVKHDGFVDGAEFSPDGKRFVTAAMDNTARVWDAKTGEPVTPPLRHETWVVYAAFSPDGLRVVTHSRDNIARVWDAQSGQPLTHPFKYQAGVPSMTFAVFSRRHPVQFTPEGQGILTPHWDNTARLWDSRNGQPLAEPLRHDQEILYTQLSPDGTKAVSASADKKARLWDVRPGQMMAEALYHNGEITSAQFSPDGRKVVTTSDDRTAWIWDVRTAAPLIGPLKHDDFVLAAQFNRNGEKLATASHDHTARVWDARTGEPLTGLLWHNDAVRSIQFSPEGQRVLTASDDGTARVWDTTSGRPLIPPLRHETNVVFAAFSPDGNQVVTTSWDGSARVWDARSGAAVTKPLMHQGRVLFAAFGPNGEQVVTASDDFSARLWNVRTGEPIAVALQHDDRVLFAEFSPDGKLVATASADKTARIWNARTGQVLTDPLRHREGVNTARFSPDGRLIVTASADQTARLWDVYSGQPVTESFRHQAGVNTAQFSPDGKNIVTASADHTARVWEIPAVPLPVPEWLPRLAEAVAGQRVNSQGVSEPVPATEAPKLKLEVAASTADDPCTKWTKWFFADRGTRTISPNSPITIPEYVRNLIEAPANYSFAASEAHYMPGYIRNQTRLSRMNRLEEAVRLAPANPLALARLARALLETPSIENPRQIGEAHWHSRRALDLAPDNLEVRQSRAEVLARSGHLNDALALMDQVLLRGPENPEFWNAKGQLLERTSRLEEAYQAYSRAIDLAPAMDKLAANVRAKALLNRYELLRKLRRPAEARDDLRSAKADLLSPVTIPRRDLKNRPGLIDLSPYLDVLLTETWAWWRGAAKKHDYGAAPRGLCTLAGVEFDLRGYLLLRRYCVPLSSEYYSDMECYSDMQTGIHIGQKCRHLHFLHAACAAGNPPNGTQVGSYIIHYANGQKVEVPLRYCQDLADFTDAQVEKNPTYVIAWAGANERVRQITGYRSIRFFKTTWENPHPDWEIKELDAVTSTKADLLLFAVTAE